MIVGTARLVLRLPENGSLKGKRQVVRSLTARLHREFNIAVAEVEDNDVWQTAVLGVACVTNDGRHADQILSRVVRFVEQSRLDAEVVDCQLDIQSVL
ncbi:MAG: DUF503 domain-containing protein [Chloroflexi bacterium]|nr:DUF503 domain-containing protein [Chloroflexota bacterium]